MLGRSRKVLVAAILWILLPGLALAGVFWLRAGLLAVGVYCLLALLVLANSMIALWLRPIRCTRELSADVVAIGESVQVLVKIHNSAPWPILWLYAEELLPPNVPRDGAWRRLLFLPPRRSFFLTYRITPHRRGCHQLGPLILESGDVFGLLRRCRIEPRLDFVTALPNCPPIADFEVGRRRRLGDRTAERGLLEDPTRIRGVREYRRGDALKRIHWKSSARSGRLWSKIYDPVIEAGATIVLDFHKDSWTGALARDPALPPPEMAVEVACAIARYLAESRWQVGLFSNGRDPLGLPGISIAQARAANSLGEALRTARSRRRDDRLAPIAIRAASVPEQFSLIHECLGRIELSDGLPIEALLMGELPYIERRQALVVIAGSVGDSFIAGLARACELGYRVLLFVVCNNEAHDRAFEELVPRGVELYRMDEIWRLREVATGRRHI